MRIMRTLVALVCLATLVVAVSPTAGEQQALFTDAPGKSMTIHALRAGHGAVRYMYTDQEGLSFDTAKVYCHVLGPDGESTLTQGGGEKVFPHHRGIFIGWNKITHGGKSHDLWHVKNTAQMHREFVQQRSTAEASTLVSLIEWIGVDKKPVLDETRTITLHHTDDAYALIDVTSVLKAAHGDVKLDGDPEHAGVQYRPSPRVAENKSAKYVFPIDKPDLAKDKDIAWVAQSHHIGDQAWTVQNMSHPDNAPGRWSAYRDYGRFGEFPVIEIGEGESVTLRFRYRITRGEAPSREALAAEYAKYVGG